MSTTPTANITSDTFPNSQPPSRHPEYDPKVPLSQSTAPSSALSHLTADLTSSHNSAQGPSHHSPPDQDVSTRRPTKRQRISRTANMAAERASSSSDASSQSGMADNETEPEPSQLSEQSAPPVTAPQKKKRTRTLTTPHQSAVLHALLAKSRFPSTAKREEVGRQIGLSARKVQIWFQNQRQKARRPQSESAPLTRPPQFGPFPIMTPAGPSFTSHPSPTASGPLSEVSHSASSSARSAHETGGSLDSIPPLSGPGMPGWPPSSHPRGPPSAEERSTPQQPTSPQTPLGNAPHAFPLRLPEDMSPHESRGDTRSLVPQPTQSLSPHLSRVLPPIHFNPSEPHRSTEPYVSARSSFPPHPSRSSVNIIQRHGTSPGEPSSSVPRRIPPPFVLQPLPQWDPQTFAPYTPPEFASWSQHSGSPLSSARSSFSPVGAHDRAPTSPRRHVFSSPSEPRRAIQLDHILSPPRDHRRATPAPSSRTSLPGHSHARPDDTGEP